MDSNTSGFTPTNVTSFAWQIGGYAGGTNTTSDLYIVSSDNIGTDITTNKIIRVRLKNTTSNTTGKIYYTTTNDISWSDSKSVSFAIAANSDYTEYAIDMSSVSG